MTLRKVVSMATQRALPPRMLPSAYRRPSCSTAGCTELLSSVFASALSMVTLCATRMEHQYDE